MKTLFLILAGASLTLVSCKRGKAVWDTDWEAPLLRDSLTLNKLIVEDSLITVNGSYLELSFDKTIFDLNLSEIVEIPDTVIKHDYAISSISITVPPGTSFVNNAKEHVIDLGEVQLKKIRVRSGGIAVKLANPVATKAHFVIELPGVTKNGVTLTKALSAEAGTAANPSEVTAFVDLTGYEMDLRGAGLDSWNRMQSTLLVTSDQYGQPVTVSPSDIFRFSFEMKDIRIDYARGYFGDQLISDTITESIDALEKIVSGMIDLPAAELALNIDNSLKVAGRVKITHVKNTNNQGNSVSLVHPSIGNWQTINSATGNEYGLQSTQTDLVFNGQNSNLEQFLENHGAKNEIGYQVQINPWGNTSGGYDEIFPQSRLRVNLAANMPLSIGLSDIVLQDTFKFSFRQDPGKTNVSSAIMTLDAVNAFPFSGDVTLYLMNASGTVITAVQGTAQVVSSVYGEIVNGVRQTRSRVDFVIPEAAFDQLDNVTQLSVRLQLNTPDEVSNMSQMVQIPANGFFGFKIGAKVKVEARI